MKSNFLVKYTLPAALGLFVAACTPSIDTPTPSKGTADFSTFVTLGNSLTAGYGDGALYRDGQINSFPNILAQQFRAVGGGEFTQPLLPEGAGFGGSAPNFNGRFSAATTTDPRLKPFVLTTNTAPSITPLSPNWRADQDVIAKNNNFGVPGARLFDVLIPGYGNPVSAAGFNPFFTRFAANPITSSMLGDAVARKPTFFVLGLGNNDVLGYATSGGTSTLTIPGALVGAPNNITAPVTPPAVFTGVYDRVLNGLLAATPDTKGVVVTIPDVTRIPFLNTVGPSLAARGVAQLVYISAAGTPALLQTNNPASGLLTLSASAALAQGLGTQTNPLPSQFVLDPAEIKICQDAITAYNNHIRTKQSNKVAVFDVTPFFNSLIGTGVTINGTTGISASFISGGVFALDGVHLTPRGYAMVANEIIKATNTTFGSSILQVNPLQYEGIIVK